MRFVQILVAAVLLLGGLWVLIGEQLAGVSADATINARLTAVRAPVAGDVTLSPLTLGSRVKAGDELGQIADPRVDAIRLDDLILEQALETAGVTRHLTIIAALETLVQALQPRTAIYDAERVAEIAARLDFAEARLALLEAAPEAENNDLSTTFGQAQTDNPGDPYLPGIALEYARERVRALEIALGAAQRGVFLGDGYNDAPWSEQWAADLQARLAEQRALLADAEARVIAVTARVNAERVRVNRLASATLIAPVDGIVWELSSALGENVQRGDAVMTLLDCDAVFVSLSVSENVYNALSVGDAATFRANGDTRSFPGTVARLAGAGAATVYQNLAVAPSLRHLQRYDVLLNVPGLAEAADLSCAVGRTGRVFFDDRPLDLFR